MQASVIVTVAILAAAILGSGCGEEDESQRLARRLEGRNVIRYPLEPHEFDGPTKTQIVTGSRDAAGRCVEAGHATTRPGEEVQEIVVAYDPDACRFEIVSGRPVRR